MLRMCVRAVAVVVAVLLLASCGGGDDPAPRASTPSDVSEAPTEAGKATDRTARSPKKKDSSAPVDPAQPYVDAIAASWAGTEGIGAEASRCWSEKFVDTVGVERLVEVGPPGEFAQTVAGLDYTALDLSRVEGETVHDHFTTCGMDVSGSILDTFAQEETFPAEARSCIDRGVDDAMMRDFVITSMVEGAEQAANSPDGMVAVVFSCAYGIDMETLLDDADG